MSFIVHLTDVQKKLRYSFLSFGNFRIKLCYIRKIFSLLSNILSSVCNFLSNLFKKAISLLPSILKKCTFW